MNIIKRIFGRKKEVKSELLRTIERRNNGVIRFMKGAAVSITPHTAYRLHERVSTVMDAVGKISRRVADLELILKKGDENITEHPALDMLSGGNTTKQKFWKEIMIAFLLTEEAYFIVRGNVNFEPLEIVPIKPFEIVSITGKKINGMPVTISTNSDADKREYNLTEDKGKFRYIDDAGLNELVPIVGDSKRSSWRGLSRLNSLIEETAHIEKGNIHNTSLLDNNLSSSHVFSPEDEIDESTGELLKDALKEHYTGSSNAGKPLILPVKMNLVSENKSTKDIEYISLIDVDETRIYRAYDIPLPLIKTKSMTRSNYESAIPYLYMDAVLPNFRYIAEFITKKILFRYKDIEDYKLACDIFAIPAMQGMQIEMMDKMNKTNSLTPNEIRAKGGYEAIDNGDKIIMPGTLTTIDDIAEQEMIPEYPEEPTIEVEED